MIQGGSKGGPQGIHFVLKTKKGIVLCPKQMKVMDIWQIAVRN